MATAKKGEWNEKLIPEHEAYPAYPERPYSEARADKDEVKAEEGDSE